MYKSLLVALAVAMLFGCVSQSMAADGNLSDSMLTDMGLSSVQVMSDDQGQEIRGKGFAFAAGASYARVRGAGSVNLYIAKGHHGAGGANMSWAQNNHHYAAAGGYSSAYAN